jgi:hypothetical protein
MSKNLETALLLQTGGTVTGNVNIDGLITSTYTGSANSSLILAGMNTKGGAGYHDFMVVKNGNASATNTNKWFRLNNTGSLEVINSGYNTAIMTLADSGNLSLSGSISPQSWVAGQVIKDTMLSNSEVTVVSNTIAATGSNVNFITYNYTPVSSSSYLIVHFHLSKYVPAGTVDDSWYSILAVDGTEISYGWQKVNDDANGTSGRSGVLFPLTGRFTNSNTATKQIQVAARRDTADDSITIDNSGSAIWLRITEVAR